MIDSQKNRLLEMYKKFKEESTTPSVLKDEVLVIDGLNTYIRCYCSLPTMNENGNHVGGISGFLKSIGYAIKVTKPSHVVIAFDGSGGSQRRRKIYPEYKNRRKTDIRLNRTYEEDYSGMSDSEQFKNQLIRLTMYLDALPVKVLAVDNIEADDTMAYIAQDFYKNKNVTLMSTDMDFMQLVSDRVKVWSPTKKRIYGPAEILNEYRISSANFILYRCLVGDVSDNIPGIRGAGLKTIIKAYPFLSEEKKYTVSDIISYSKTKPSKLKIYDTVIESESQLATNYQLMQLDTSIIQNFTQLKIHDLLKSKTNSLNRYTFSNLITEDKMWNTIPESQIWLADVFNRLNSNIL